MKAPSAKLLAFGAGSLACVKIVGKANFTSSVDFKTLLTELPRLGYQCVVLELSECLLMDSTFLGVLAGFGLNRAPGPSGEAKPNGAIRLLNPNDRLTESLENLGVMHLFQVVRGPAALPEQLQALATPATPAPTRQEVTQTCLDAHHTLMDICPANIPKFKDVAQFLAEELKKCKGGQ